MKVVIIEGACNKSEWLFWKFLSEQVFVNIQGRVYGAGGTQHFVNITRHLCNEMLQYYRDTGEKSQILACYDTTGITGYVDKVRRGLNNIKKTLDSTGVDLQIIERYCFEDCLLLFAEFSKWLLANGLQEQDKNLLEYYLYTLDNWRDSQELVNFVKTQKEYKRRFYEFKTRNNLPDEIATEIVLRNTSQEKLGGCKIFCVYGNETFQIRIRYVVVFVGFCSRIFCRIYLSGYSISCPLSFIHAF